MPTAKPPLSLENTLAFHEFCKEMEKQGVKNITVEYSGGGDEGSINEVIFTPPKKGAKKEDDGYSWNSAPEVEEMFDLILEEHGYDYSNNDGGSGSLLLNIEERTWTLDMTYFETVYSEPENEDDEPEEEDYLEHPEPTTTGGAREEDFKALMMSNDREDRAKIIGLLPELLPEIRAIEAQKKAQKKAETQKPKKPGAKKAAAKKPSAKPKPKR